MKLDQFIPEGLTSFTTALSDDGFAMNLVHTGDFVSHINWYVRSCLVDSSPEASCVSSTRFINLSSSLRKSIVMCDCAIVLDCVCIGWSSTSVYHRHCVRLRVQSTSSDCHHVLSSASSSHPVGSSPVQCLPVWAFLRRRRFL